MKVIYKGKVSLIEKVWPESDVLAGVQVSVIDMGKSMDLVLAAKEILAAGWAFAPTEILTQFVQQLEPGNYQLLPLATLTPECKGPYVHVYVIGEFCGSIYYQHIWLNGLPKGIKLLVFQDKKYSVK